MNIALSEVCALTSALLVEFYFPR